MSRDKHVPKCPKVSSKNGTFIGFLRESLPIVPSKERFIADVQAFVDEMVRLGPDPVGPAAGNRAGGASYLATWNERH
jgi:hypothetical protein